MKNKPLISAKMLYKYTWQGRLVETHFLEWLKEFKKLSYNEGYKAGMLKASNLNKLITENADA